MDTPDETRLNDSPEFVPPTQKMEKRKRKLPWHLSESQVAPQKKAPVTSM